MWPPGNTSYGVMDTIYALIDVYLYRCIWITRRYVDNLILWCSRWRQYVRHGVYRLPWRRHLPPAATDDACRMSRFFAAVVQPVSLSGRRASGLSLCDAAARRRTAVLSLRRRRRQMRRHSTKFTAGVFASAAAATVVSRPHFSLCTQSRLQVRSRILLVSNHRLSLILKHNF